MDSRDRFEAQRRNFGGYEPQTAVAEYPSMAERPNRAMYSHTPEAQRRSSGKSCVSGSTWSGNIMWTFAFGEKEISQMAGSVFSSGRQAWHMLNQMNDLCRSRHSTMLKSSALLIRLASELRAIAIECLEDRFAMELRVTKGGDGSPDLELMDNGMWRKPGLRASTISERGTVMVEMGD